MKITIDKDFLSTIIYILFTIPFLDIGYFQQFELSEMLRRVLCIIIFLILAFLFIVYKIPLSAVTVAIIVSQGYLLLVTLIYSGNSMNCIIRLFQIISVILLYEVGLKTNPLTFIRSQLFCFFIIISINLITEILYPYGMYQIYENEFLATRNYFLGYYNRLTQYFLPALFLSSLYIILTGKKVISILLISMIFISGFLSGSGGVIVALVAYAIGFFLHNRLVIFNYINYWLSQVIYVILVIVFSLTEGVVSSVAELLNKAASFQARLRLWAITLRLVLEHPLFGYGFEERAYRLSKTKIGTWAGYAHNGLLEILYKGGIIYLLLFATIILIVGFRLRNFEDKNIVKYASLPFLGWSVACYTDAFFLPFLVVMFIIAYNLEYIFSDNDEIIMDGKEKIWNYKN